MSFLLIFEGKMVAANATVYSIKEMTIAGRITIVTIIIFLIAFIVFLLKRK